MYKDIFSIIVLILVILAVCALLPILLIWSLNTLFTLNIDYNLQTMFAAFILLMLVNSQASVK